MDKQLIDNAHEIWAAAQLLPGEGIEDGVNRIAAILERLAPEVCRAQNAESERQDGLSLTDATQRIAELEAESIEQCRVIGMSGEMEARHLAAISDLERECNGLAARIGKELNVENEALKVRVSEQAALIEKCEKALDTTIVNAPDPYCAITRRVRAIQDEALAAISAQKGGAA